MSLEKVTRVSGRAVHVAGEDIDTDRIIPARFLRCVTFDGLGEHLFADARLDTKRGGAVHPLDDERRRGAKVLVSGRNFGCGSSREHAAQSLAKYGIRTVVAESFAEIFFGNATTLGIVCASLDRADLDALAARVEADPSLEVLVDLESQRVTAAGASHPFAIKASARRVLLDGTWDPIAWLLERPAAVDATAARLPYLGWTHGTR